MKLHISATGESSDMKQQVSYQLRYICMGKPFLHKIHIPLIVGENKQNQSELCEEELSDIFHQKI